MVASDQGSQFAASHGEVAVGLVQIAADGGDLGVNSLDVVGGRLGGKFGVHGGVQRAQLLCGFGVELRGLGASLAQLALGNLELVGHNLQVALEVGVGLFIHREPVLHRGQVLLRGLLNSLNLIGDSLLGGVQLGRIRPAEEKPAQRDQGKNGDRRHLPGATPISICIFWDLRHSRYFLLTHSGKPFVLQCGSAWRLPDAVYVFLMCKRNAARRWQGWQA